MSNANVQTANHGGSIFTRVSGLVLGLFSTIVSAAGAIIGIYAFYTILCNAGNAKGIEGNYFDSLRLSFREWFTGGEESYLVMFLEIIMSVLVAGVIIGACIGIAFVLKWIVDGMKVEENLPDSYKKSVEGTIMNVLAIISFAAGIIATIVNICTSIISASFSVGQFIVFTIIALSAGCLLYGIFKALSLLSYNSKKH